MIRHCKLSATCLSAVKKCPPIYRLGYIEGLRLVEKTDGLRVGTNWHECQEVAQNARTMGVDPLTEVTTRLHETYQHVPDNRDATAWAVERAMLAYSMAGHLWYWQNDEIEPIATELEFELPVRNPTTGRALPHVSLVGKIDLLARWRNRLVILDYKSTSKGVDSDSSFWARMKLDTQITTYLKAARIMQVSGELEKYGVSRDEPLVSGCYLDAWHKPGIKPKKLTQGESKAFVETGEYCGQKFNVDGSKGPLCYEIDGSATTVELGAAPKPKKDGTVAPTPFAIRETPEMYGARLLQDITERPEYYFARREIARTDAELGAFEWELYAIYKTIRTMEHNGYWWRDETQCDAPYRCPYSVLCWHGMDRKVCDGKTTPDGFRRIYDLNTQVTEED